MNPFHKCKTNLKKKLVEEGCSDEKYGRVLLEPLEDWEDVKIAIAIILAIAVNIGNFVFSLLTISKIEIGIGNLLEQKKAQFSLK